MSAVEEYKEWCRNAAHDPYGNEFSVVSITPKHYADAAIAELEAERDVLQVAFTQKNNEHVTVVGCISAWVNRLPRELGVAIHAGQKLVEPREGGEA